MYYTGNLTTGQKGFNPYSSDRKKNKTINIKAESTDPSAITPSPVVGREKKTVVQIISCVGVGFCNVKQTSDS